MRDEKYTAVWTRKMNGEAYRSKKTVFTVKHGGGSIMVCPDHKAELAGGIRPIWSLNFFWTSCSLDYKSK